MATSIRKLTAADVGTLDAIYGSLVAGCSLDLAGEQLRPNFDVPAFDILRDYLLDATPKPNQDVLLASEGADVQGLMVVWSPHPAQVMWVCVNWHLLDTFDEQAALIGSLIEWAAVQYGDVTGTVVDDQLRAYLLDAVPNLVPISEDGRSLRCTP